MIGNINANNINVTPEEIGTMTFDEIFGFATEELELV